MSTSSTSVRHFLSLRDLTPDQLRGLLARAGELKRRHEAGERVATLPGKTLAMVFEKSSTRTRVSFEAGMNQLGGSALFLSPRDTQLGRGEPIEDTARVLSRMVDLIMIRTFAHEKLERFAAHSRVPVINGLTDFCHPCQLLADMQTYFEHRGDIRGKTVAWIGDGNNMCNSYIAVASLLDFQLRVAAPEGYDPIPEAIALAPERVRITRNPREAVADADLVVTDVWTSMGQEEEDAHRRRRFADFQVNHALMALADENALFMHCLPAHRGEEISAELMEEADSVVWDEAENRLHAQKAIMRWCLGV